MVQQEISLKVQEALQEEAYKGIVRIDAQTMRQIDVRAGDIIEIEGGRKTVGIVDRSYPSDIGQNIIRMDGILRRNAKTGIGENVKIRKVEVKEAKSITIAPAQQGVMIQANNELFKQGLMGRAVVKGDIISLGGARRRRRTLSGSNFDDIFNVFEERFMGNFGFGSLKFIVAETNPKGAAIITENTEVKVSSKAVQVTEERVPDVTYEDIGGLEEEIKKLREMVELPIKNPEIFERLGVEPPKGVLLYGPPGTGKTLLAKAVANESEANFLLVNGPELTSKFYGETEKRIRDLFEEAEKNAPSIIFIDEIDALAPKRDETYGEVERRMVSQLLCLDPQTPVYLKDGIKTIQELFESVDGETFKDEYGVEHKLPQREVEVQAFTPEGRIKNTKIIALSKTRVPKAFTVNLENGASITSSAITKFLSINNEGVTWKQADEIIPEDYVFVPRKLMFTDHIQKIDLAKLKEKDKWVVELKEGIIKKLYKRNHILLKELEDLEQKKMLPETSMRNKIINCLLNKELTKEYLERKLQISRKALNNYLKPLINNKIIKQAQEKITIQVQLLDLDNEIEALARKENRKVYPLKKNYFIAKPEVLDEDLAKLIGLIIADGHIGPYRVNLSGETSGIGREIYNRKFNKDRRLDFQKIDRLEMYSRSFSKFLEEYFGLSAGKKAYIVKVPEQFYNSPNSVKAAFLAGILEGDGSPTDVIRFNTMSYDLAIGIARLLTSLGILSKIKKYNTYVVQIAGGYESFEKLLEHILPYLQLERKRKKLLAFLDRIKKVSRLVYPIKAGLKRVRDEHGIVIDDNMYRYLSPNLSYNINGNVLGYFVQKLGHLENKFVQEIKQIHHSEAVPCKVVGVEQGEGGVMYDLTTEYSNFIAGNIPIILHNTVMDGLKSRGRVVVIGATNRPNSIDPALRRPGRFDREISIGVPNKAGRLNVLKIHTRNMPIEGPLDKEIMGKVLLDELESYLKENKIEREKTEQQLNDLKLKKAGEKSLLDKLTNVIIGLSSKIEKLERYHELFIKKDKLSELVIEISQIERNKEKIEEGEARDILLEKKKIKLSENYEPIIKDLKEFKIINSNFFNKIRDKSTKKELERLAEITHGFVGADLQALCKEAAMNVIRRVLPDLKGESEKISPEVLAKLVITAEDFRAALKIVRPSALREVLIERPTTTWEDVGGLQELKQQLKEAVEWPLKNPKMFSRLGIKPPRGILIYGPPGTGKTMLARAVAHESEANFISVKGPEVLSKWVGESLPYDEELLVKKNGRIKRMKIGDIVEKRENIEVLTFDKENRINFSKIDDFIKHKLTSNLLEVKTRTGRSIKVTEDHSLFSFINGRIESIPTSHLIAGESFIVIPKRINLPREHLENINLYEYFKKDKSIFVGNVHEYIKRAKKILGLQKTAEILEVSKKYLSDLVGKQLPISILCFDKLMNEAKLALDIINIKIKLKGSIHEYEALFKLNKDFWRLIGLWVAEGDFNGYTIRIHNQNQEIRKDAEEICKKYGFSISAGETCFSINSLFLQKVLRNVFDLQEGAENKKIPELLFGLDKESKVNFLKGYFSGDGSNYPAERGKFKIEAGTVSKTLANDLLYLLLDLSIVATMYKKQERTGSTTHRISILGVRNFEKFKEIGFIDQQRNNRINQYIESRKWVRSDLIPLSGELYDLASHSITVGSSLGKERLQEVLILIDKDKTKYKEYWDLVEGDLFFDQVKEIKRIQNEEFVYDISVPDGQNFIGGFGGIFAHNSEKAVRKIFEKARQTAPTIIFFDEIDAVAPRRGTDTGSNVTERIVNTMLVEMDGLEELADVVVIAATNRPDLVDPSLLRPGRFDRVIAAPMPNKESRKAIFNVHIGKMPLTKDVDIDKLTEKTEGYSGADIYGVVREAAMHALRKNMDAIEVTAADFEEALKKVSPSLKEEDLKKYKEVEEKYLRKAKIAAVVAPKPSYLG